MCLLWRVFFWGSPAWTWLEQQEVVLAMFSFKLFSFWGRKRRVSSFKQALESWSANLLALSCGFKSQIGWNLWFHWGSSLMIQPEHTRTMTSCTSMCGKLVYLNWFDTSWYINTSDFFIPSLPSAFEFRFFRNAQVIAYITARTGTERLFRDITECIWGLQKLLENERPIRTDQLYIQCFGVV